HYPIVVIGALKPSERESVVAFLLRFKAPIYVEGPSGLREDPRLAPWRVAIDQIWTRSSQSGYPIDGVLRIGSIPTGRIWRDLDEKNGAVKVCSICELPFSGLSWAEGIYTPFNLFYEKVQQRQFDVHYPCQKWLQQEKEAEEKLLHLFHEEPKAEASLFYHLSKHIAKGSLVYLGNSLPVREWDLAATFEPKQLNVAVSRGLCGIDGQISTFLGMSSAEQENWALIGDLTALYDMAAPWILEQLPGHHVNLVVVNNGGGQIFSRHFSHRSFLNEHQLNFGPLADFWNWQYERWEEVPQHLSAAKRGRLIEILPDPDATNRFWTKLKK
ncbi:MAG: thiamine pyrophosphate-binding protein, partial [Chlamydiales bacterium]